MGGSAIGEQIELTFLDAVFHLATGAIELFVEGLRRIGLAGTGLADATCGAIRLKLLKIGAFVRVSTRRIKFSMASAFPYTDVFRTTWASLDKAAL